MKTAGALVALCLAFSAMACDKQKSPETADAIEEGPIEETQEWSEEAADDTEDAFEEAREETEDALEEAGDEMDDNPATD